MRKTARPLWDDKAGGSVKKMAEVPKPELYVIYMGEKKEPLSNLHKSKAVSDVLGLSSAIDTYVIFK